MKKILLLSLIFIAAYGCEKSVPADNSLSLIGKWNWKSASGGITGNIITPVSTGDTIVIEFTKDSLYKISYDGSLVQQCPFHTIKSANSVNEEMANILTFDTITWTPYYFIKNDTLIINDDMADGYRWVYVRIK